MVYDEEKAKAILRTWFDKAPIWQKKIFCCLLNGMNDENQLIKQAIQLINQEFLLNKEPFLDSISFPDNLFFSNNQSSFIRLNSISDVKGVGALSSSKPLCFGDGLSVVYGENGCGKTSYVRILKAAEYPQYSDNVFGNIFEPYPEESSASLSFSVGDSIHVKKWDKKNNKKYPILIYDSMIAHQFVDQEKEVIYEPKVLSIISHMAIIFSKLSDYYQDQYLKKEQEYDDIPVEIRNHPLITQFFNNQKEQNIEWNQKKEIELQEITNSLNVDDPKNEIAVLQSCKQIIIRYRDDILELYQLVSKNAYDAFIFKQKAYLKAKKEAENITYLNACKSDFRTFGNDSWKKMWYAAMDFSIETRSIGDNIPSIDGRCALCQQMLDDDAEKKLSAFSDFIRSDVITTVQDAYTDYNRTLNTLNIKIGNRINIDEIKQNLISSFISSEVQEFIFSCYKVIIDRYNYFIGLSIEKSKSEFPDMFLQEAPVTNFDKIISNIERQIELLHKMEKNKEEQLIQQRTLMACQWINNNQHIKRVLFKIEAIKKSCKTNSITILKKDLSDILITQNYIDRFSKEMAALDKNNKIKVELVSKGARYGRSYHQISLKGIKSHDHKRKTSDILSEGEYRVVSLAAFLADISYFGMSIPFVFDDPITSLDQKYEENVAKRLITLSLERQVIVFTHRLAFAQFIDRNISEFNSHIDNDNQRRALITHIELRRDPLGQPNETPNYIESVSIQTKLNEMINGDIPNIDKLQKEGNYVAADIAMQSICTQFRNIIERGIEHNLLSGIVLRFNRNISSMKLPRLYALTKEDIDIFNELMSKYSAFDHSQSIETPIELPSIFDVKTDMIKLVQWCKEYKKRCDFAESHARGKL